MKYDHASYLRNIHDNERAARDFAENFAGTDLAMRHESLRAEREGQAAALAANGPIIRGEVNAILKANPTLSLETAHILAARNLGIL
jgi:hypothetical protein